jgi:GNAT superfamily N-acetyltransferase
MQTPKQKKIGSTELLEAMDSNLAEHACHLHRTTSGMTVVVEGDILIADSGLGHDTFNIVASARFNQEEADNRIREVITRIMQAERPFSWWVGPASRPLDLGERLIAAGMKATESEAAMYSSLTDIPELSATPNLKIELVTTPAQLRDVASVIAANWDPIAEDVIRFYDLVTEAALSPDCKAKYFVGYVDDEPVAVSEIFTYAGVVGLYGVAVLSSMRRRGYGTALTLAPLHHAREQGEEVAVLQASADGQYVYTQLGFIPSGEFTEYAL